MRGFKPCEVFRHAVSYYEWPCLMSLREVVSKVLGMGTHCQSLPSYYERERHGDGGCACMCGVCWCACVLGKETKKQRQRAEVSKQEER
jgi:hypothetical protein